MALDPGMALDVSSDVRECFGGPGLGRNDIEIVQESEKVLVWQQMPVSRDQRVVLSEGVQRWLQRTSLLPAFRLLNFMLFPIVVCPDKAGRGP